MRISFSWIFLKKITYAPSAPNPTPKRLYKTSNTDSSPIEIFLTLHNHTPDNHSTRSRFILACRNLSLLINLLVLNQEEKGRSPKSQDFDHESALEFIIAQHVRYKNNSILLIMIKNYLFIT